eukprot:EG_transcript_60
MAATPVTAIPNNAWVSLCCEEAGRTGWLMPTALLASDVVVGDVPTPSPSSITLSLPSSLGTPPRLEAGPEHFEGCVFVLHAVDKFLAAKGTAQPPSAAHSGGTISYGQVVQLGHVYTDRWLGVCRRVQAEQEKSSFRVVLLKPEEVEDERLIRFRLLPRYKVRSEGERVRFLDQVLFCPEWDDSRFLHATSKPLSAHGSAREVCCSFNQTCWTVRLYDDPTFEPRTVRLGTPVALFHAEIEAFLSAEGDPAGEEAEEEEGDWQSPATVFLEGSASAGRAAPPLRGPSLTQDFSLDLHIPTLSAIPTVEDEEDLSFDPSPDMSPDVSFQAKQPAGAMARSPTAPGPWARRIHSPRKAEAMTHTRRTSAAELRRPRADAAAHVIVLPKAATQEASVARSTSGIDRTGRYINHAVRRGLSPGVDGDRSRVPDHVGLARTLVAVQERHQQPEEVTLTSTPGSFASSRLDETVRLDALPHTESASQHAYSVSRRMLHFIGNLCGSEEEEGVPHNVVYLLHLPRQRTSYRMTEALDVGSNDLWLIEGRDPSLGGPVAYRTPYRLKHTASQRYFGFACPAPDSPALLMTRQPDDDSLFEFLPWEPGQRFMGLSDSYFLVRHVVTGYHLHFVAETTAPAVRQAGGRMVTQVGLSERLFYEDIFCGVCRPAALLQQKLNVVTYNLNALRGFLRSLKEKRAQFVTDSVQDGISKARQAVAHLVVFCTSSPDTNPMTREGVPIPKHQELLMDQNVHLLLLRMLKLLSLQRLDKPHQDWPLVHHKVKYLCQLCYRLLRHMVRGSVHYALRLAPHVPFLQSQVKLGFGAVEAIVEVFRNNRVLLEQIDEEVLDCLVQMAYKEHAKCLTFLAELCVCETVGIPKTQQIVCQRLLTETRGDLLLPLRYHAGTVEVQYAEPKAATADPTEPSSVLTSPKKGPRPPTLAATSSQKNVRRMQRAVDALRAMKSLGGPSGAAMAEAAAEGSKPAPEWVPLDEFCKSARSAQLAFLEGMLSLFWRLCVGRNPEVMPVVQQYVTADMMQCVFSEDLALPASILCQFFLIATHVHLPAPDPRGAQRRTIKLWHRLDGSFSRPAADPLVTVAKAAALRLLAGGVQLPYPDVDALRLWRAALGMWKAVIHSGCYTVGELRELMEYLARLLRVPLDAKHMAVYSRDGTAASLFEPTEGSILVVQSKGLMLEIINVFLDQYQGDTVEAIMTSFKAAVQTQGVAELQKRQSAATAGLLGAVEQTLVQATPRAAPKLDASVGELDEDSGSMSLGSSAMPGSPSLARGQSCPFPHLGVELAQRRVSFPSRSPRPKRQRLYNRLARRNTFRGVARESSTLIDVQAMVPVLLDLTLYHDEPLSRAAVDLAFRLHSFKGEVRSLVSQQLLLFDEESEEFWKSASLSVATLQQAAHTRLTPEVVAQARQVLSDLLNAVADVGQEPAEGGAWEEVPPLDREESSFTLNTLSATSSFLSSGTSLQGFRRMSHRNMSGMFTLRKTDLTRRVINQDILRHLDAHRWVVNLLEVPIATDPSQKELRRLQEDCYLFLHQFCDGNPGNQTALMALGGPLFLRHIPYDIGADDLIMKLYENNYDLCAQISAETVGTFLGLWGRSPTHLRYLDFLRDVTVVGGLPIARTQTLVMNALVEQHSDLVQSYVTVTGQAPWATQQAAAAVVQLMAQCCVGLNSSTEAPAQGFLSLEQSMRILAETDHPLPLDVQLPFVTFMREVYVVKEESGQEAAEAPAEDAWFLDQNWFFVVSRFRAVVADFVAPPPDMAPEEDERYTSFVFEGVVPCMADFFESCLQDPAAADKVAMALWAETSALVMDLVQLVDCPDRLQLGGLLGCRALEKCLGLAARVDLLPGEGVEEGWRRCTAAAEAVAAEAKPEGSKFALVRGALQVFQGAVAERGRGVGVDDSDTFAALIHEYLEDEAGRFVMERLVAKMKGGLDLQRNTKIGLLRLFTHLIKSADDKEAAQIHMSSEREEGGLGLTPLVSMIAESADEAVAYEAIDFGIALFEGGNAVAQAALMRWFGQADQCFFDSVVEKLRTSAQVLKDRQREKAFFKEQLFHTPEEHTACFELLERRTEITRLQAVLRLLQLLCEGHHLPLQQYVRQQATTHHSYNMVTEVVVFLKELLALEMDNTLLGIAVQSFNTLTEFCQGPCHENQETLVACNVCHEVNVVFRPMASTLDPVLVLELRSVAVVMLLSLLEGHTARTRPQLMVHVLEFPTMGAILDAMWREVSPALHAPEGPTQKQEQQLDFTFSIFLLLHVLKTMAGDEALAEVLQGCEGLTELEAMLCVVEIARGDTLERVYFRKPTLCQTLPAAARDAILETVSRQSPSAKLTDFFAQAQARLHLMEHQHRCQTFLLRRCPRAPALSWGTHPVPFS